MILVGFSLLWCSCQKEDSPIFSKSADERLTEKLDGYATLLKKAEFGWKAAYFPDSASYGGWSFWIKFEDNGVVKMLSDYDATASKTVLESHYRVGGSHLPSLIFDSYTYIHNLANPGLGKKGQGFKGDFEFSFSKVVGDTIYLKSHYDKSILKLVAAKAEDKNIERNFAVQSSLRLLFEDVSKPYFKTLKLGETNVELGYDTYTRRMTFKYQDGSNMVVENRGVAFLGNGILLALPIKFPKISKAISFFPLNTEVDGSFSVSIPEQGLSGRIVAGHIPAFPYLNGIKDLQREKIMIVNNVSSSLTAMFKNIRFIPSYKSLQFFYGSNDRFGLGVYTIKGTDKVTYKYDLDWQYGEDGVLRATYKGTENGAIYEPTMTPFIDKLCNPEGFSVLDFQMWSFMGMRYYTVTLVSRKDSRDWIVLASQSF